MNIVLRPSTLRSIPALSGFDGIFESNPGQKVTVGCLIAVAAMAARKRKSKPLPPVTVDAPVARPKPPAAKPSPEQMRARNAVRRVAREKAAAAARAEAEAAAEAKKQLAQQDPYADPAAPYKADRLASPKFPEPIVNTPRSVTVLTKEVLRDKDATSLKEVVRTTPGVTLGTGEGGNAFGDRFFIRGFDARNDVFVDGIRDPGRQHPREFLHRADRNSQRAVVDDRRPRHDRRRAQHRHQAGQRASQLLQRRHEIRERRHQARHFRRQSGDQPDACRPHGRHVAERRMSPSATSRPMTAGAGWRR